MYHDDTHYLCPRFDRKWIELAAELGKEIIADDAVKNILRGKENWTKIENYMYIIMKLKRQDDMDNIEM